MSKRTTIQVLAVVVGLSVLAIALPWFIRARTVSAYNACINNLRQIEGAIQQWALEHNAFPTNVVSRDTIRSYLFRGKESELPRCPHGGTYSIGRVADPPRCSIMHHNLEFGYVTVVDEFEVPLPDAQVSVRGRDTEICSVRTATNGDAYFFTNWRSGLWDNVVTNSWSDGTKHVVARKDGYRIESVALPTSDWPIRFTLKREAR